MILGFQVITTMNNPPYKWQNWKFPVNWQTTLQPLLSPINSIQCLVSLIGFLFSCALNWLLFLFSLGHFSNLFSVWFSGSRYPRGLFRSCWIQKRSFFSDATFSFSIGNFLTKDNAQPSPSSLMDTLITSFLLKTNHREEIQ